MKRLFPLVLGWLLVVPAGAQAAVAPDEMIRALSTQIIDDQARQGPAERRPEEDVAFVDETIMPNVNFERMTALAVGRNWRQATPEQQQQLMTEFRALLLRTYAGALSSVKDQTVRMKPLRADPADTEVVVRSEIVQSRGDPIQLDYRLEKANSSWRIYDLNVLGVWLVESYRNQFTQEISAQRHRRSDQGPRRAQPEVRAGDQVGPNETFAQATRLAPTAPAVPGRGHAPERGGSARAGPSARGRRRGGPLDAGPLRLGRRRRCWSSLPGARQPPAGLRVSSACRRTCASWLRCTASTACCSAGRLTGSAAPPLPPLPTPPCRPPSTCHRSSSATATSRRCAG